MKKEFFTEYLKKENFKKKQVLYVMNPNKFRACEFLIRFHERERGEKIIVFSDNLFALNEYAMKLRKPMAMYYSTKRQQFLIDQGYSFKVITSLPPDCGSELSYSSVQEQRDLLRKVLTAGDEAVDLEMLEEDADEIALKKARRTSGSMSVMLSADGMVYTEYNTGHKRGHVKSKIKPKDLSKRHCLFKKRFISRNPVQNS